MQAHGCVHTSHAYCHSLRVSFMQNGLVKKVDKSRKQKKERRKRAKKVRGVKKASSAGEWPRAGPVGQAV